MEIVLWVVHILVALGLIGLVLLQQGKGADIGAAFGSGASNTVFGARGSANFLSRSTAVLAVMFFVTSLSMAYFVTAAPKHKSVIERAQPAAQEPEQKAKAANEQELVNQLSQQLKKSSDAPAVPAPAPEAPKENK
jgi:preprotein translocase subunit SecG